ncbi:MAG TPA: pyridoxamine 5'-phosphate oxidase family protein [Myxococcaceae bacterium]|nr:pyridoxamine 5'-phosphate oxidase family protein [Myxococcaceae bacterium]
MSAAYGQREVLENAECRRLLTEVGVGHVAFSAEALPAIQPVVFAVHDGQVVFRALPAGALAEACRGVVAVAADAYHRTSGVAWSVTVVGPARVVTDAGEVAALDALDLASWPGSESRCYIAVDIGVVTGWRVRGGRPAWGDGRAGSERARAGA